MASGSSSAVDDRSSPVAADPAVAFAAQPVVLFFVLAYAFSWAWVIPWAATGHTVFQGRGWPTSFPSLIGPMLAALIVTARTTGTLGVRDLMARMMRWRIGWRWWLAASSPLAFLVVVIAGMRIVGADLPARGDFARFSGLSSGLGIVGVALAVILINGLGEETGWRGFALPHLQRRFSPLSATLIIAVLWAGWHIPQFFLLDSYKDFSAPMLPVFVFGLTCGAVVCTWIYNHTGGSVLAVAVWHGLYNMTGGTKAATAGSGTIAAAIWTLVVTHAVVLVVLERRARRHGRPSILAAP